MLIGSFGVCAIALAVCSLAATEPRTDVAPKLSPGAQRAVYPKGPDEMEPLARRDPLALLRLSLRWYEQRVTDYTCYFYKQERIDGKLQDPETMLMKFREKPFSVYLKWVKNPSKDQEVIYVEGENDNKAVVHPSGLLGVVFRKVKLDPEGKLALKHSRRPVTYAGLGNMLRVTIPQCETAQANGDLSLEYLGIRMEADRPTYVIRRVLPEKSDYPSHQLFIFIDVQFLIPVRTEAYLWDGTLLSDYRYTGLEINLGVGTDDFDPDNPAYGYRLF